MTDLKCINLGYICSEVESVEVEATFQKHAEWMTEFYSEPNGGLDHLVSAYFT